MRKHIFTLAAALLVAGSISAQEIALGVKGGLNIPKITSGGGTQTPLSEGYSSRMAANGGIFADFQLTRVMSLQVGFEYSGQGGEKNGLQAVPSAQVFGNLQTGLAGNAQTAPLAAVVPAAEALVNADYLYADFKSTAKFNYVMLPVQLKFGWKLSDRSPVKVYVSGGLFGSYLISGKRYQRGTSSFYYSQNGTKINMTTFWNNQPDAIKSPLTNPYAPYEEMIFGIMDTSTPGNMDKDMGITKDLYRWNFGFIGAAGFSYRFLPRHNLFVEAGGNYSFLKIQRNEANGQNRIGAGSVSLGYSYVICKGKK